MKAIINGRIYNTETADLVCEVSHSSKSSFDWHETELYRTPTPFAKRWRIIDSTARSGAVGSNPVEPTESPPTFGLLGDGAFSPVTLVLSICTY